MFSVQRRLQAIIMKLLLWLVSPDKLARDKTHLRPLGQTVGGPKTNLKSQFFIFTLLLRDQLFHRSVYTGGCVSLRIRGERVRWREMENVDIDCHTLARPRHFLQRLHRRSFFLQLPRSCSDPPRVVGTCLKRTFWIECITVTGDPEE